VRLWWLLRWLGHKRVTVLDGGWQAWREAGGEETGQIPATRTNKAYPGRPNPGMLVSAAEIQADPAREKWRLLDARTSERYRGDQEPIDPVPGHIPGALSLPFQRNLDASGRFLPPESLRRLYIDILDGAEPTTVVCYCGSGVTAGHNLLAMEIAGLSGARLYAGSWSEWIRDPQRSVALGTE
jgi:thiosulfate/3-mercaptopyruvate sulfurtransferase